MNSDELNNLIHGTLNDQLDEEQMARLEQLLMEDPIARAAYLQHANLHAALKQRYFAAEETEAPDQEADASVSGEEFFVLQDEDDVDESLMGDWPAYRRRRRLPTAWRRRTPRGSYGTWAALLVAGLGLMIALIAVMLPSGRPIPTAAMNPPQTHFKGVAVVTRQVDAAWGRGGLKVRIGHPLPTGRLVLESGLAQIEFYQGVTAVLEGPAELVLLDENRAICHRGRIRALVSPQAKGFTIQTPESRVVDLGTELGVLVKPDAPTEVHVFDGEVEVHQPGASRSRPTRPALSARN